MSASEFMKELEYLLQDIPDEEKADALGYYRDYLDEAGEDAEAAVLEFGSPERIAAIIRTDIAGHLENGGEFTERGYEDERFRDPNYRMAKRYDLPEVDEKAYEKKREQQTKDQRQARSSQTSDNNTVKIILLVLLAIVTSPVWLGVGGGLLGVLIGVFAALFAIVASVGIVTVAFFLAGIICGVVGAVYMVTNPVGGLLSIGVGCLLLGLAFLGLILTMQIFGRLIPWMVRGIVDLISGLFRGKDGHR